MSGEIIKTFDYPQAVEYMRVYWGSYNKLSEAIGIEARRLSAWRHGRSKPVGDEVLLLVNHAKRCLDVSEFGECAGWE